MCVVFARAAQQPSTCGYDPACGFMLVSYMILRLEGSGSVGIS